MDGGILEVRTADGGAIRAQCVFNCTYSQINRLLTQSGLEPLPVKHEITELALIAPPPALRNLGVTLMDGPFFSTMPFPAENLHSLSHVRYTPHESWVEPAAMRDPHAYLEARPPQSNCMYMIRDAKRYLPAIGEAKHVRSLFTVKTVLVQNEVDDGRPILLRWHPDLGNMATIMGGKIDNIYDVLAALGSLQQVSSTPVPQ
jgi:glycine/D-amino acid oxidase-like deaminating enzyme